jgi:hypothetical protein
MEKTDTSSMTGLDLSFGLQADYAAVVEGMKKAGIGDEFFTWLKIESFGELLVSYLATQEQLGGFQIEILGKK